MVLYLSSSSATSVRSEEVRAVVPDDPLSKFRQLFIEHDRIDFTQSELARTIDELNEALGSGAWLNDSTQLGTVCAKFTDRVLPYMRFCDETKKTERKSECDELVRIFTKEFVERMNGKHRSVPPWGKNWYHHSISATFVLAQVVLLRDMEADVRDAARDEIARIIDDPFNSLGRRRTMRQAFQMTVPWLVATTAVETNGTHAITRQLCDHTRECLVTLNNMIDGRVDSARGEFEASVYYAVVFASSFLARVCDDAVDLVRDVRWENIVHPDFTVARFPDPMFALGSESYSKLWFEKRDAYGVWTNGHVWRVFTRTAKLLLRMPCDGVSEKLGLFVTLGEVRDERASIITNWRVYKCEGDEAYFEITVGDSKRKPLYFSRYRYVWDAGREIVKINHSVRSYADELLIAYYPGAVESVRLANGETRVLESDVTMGKR